MEASIKEEKGNAVGQTKKRKWGTLFLHFLMYGGWLLVVALVVGIAIVISLLSK